MSQQETPTRLEVLNNFEINMRELLRTQQLSRDNFMRDMLLVSRYVGAVKDGVFLAQEIKICFQVFYHWLILIGKNRHLHHWFKLLKNMQKVLLII